MPPPGSKQGEKATGEPQRMAQLEGENDQEIQIPSSVDLPEPGGQLSYEGLCLVRCFRCEAP